MLRWSFWGPVPEVDLEFVDPSLTQCRHRAVKSWEVANPAAERAEGSGRKANLKHYEVALRRGLDRCRRHCAGCNQLFKNSRRQFFVQIQHACSIAQLVLVCSRSEGGDCRNDFRSCGARFGQIPGSAADGTPAPFGQIPGSLAPVVRDQFGQIPGSSIGPARRSVEWSRPPFGQIPGYALPIRHVLP